MVGGQRVTRHERTMIWLMLADRIDNLLADCRPRTDVERDRFASAVMDYHALRAMGSAALVVPHEERVTPHLFLC